MTNNLSIPKKPLVAPPSKKIDPPKLFNEAGFLSAHGREEIKDLQAVIKHYLQQGKSESEVRLIGSILMNAIGAEISDALLRK
jgi:hypothetical protein